MHNAPILHILHTLNRETKSYRLSCLINTIGKLGLRSGDVKKDSQAINELIESSSVADLNSKTDRYCNQTPYTWAMISASCIQDPSYQEERDALIQIAIKLLSKAGLPADSYPSKQIEEDSEKIRSLNNPELTAAFLNARAARDAAQEAQNLAITASTLSLTATT